VVTDSRRLATYTPHRDTRSGFIETIVSDSWTPQESLPRVMHVLEAVGGGTLRHIVDTIETVDNVEHHIVIPIDLDKSGAVTPNSEATKIVSDAGAVIHRVSMLRNPIDPRNATGVIKLRQLIKKLDPVVIHGHSSVGGAFARVAAIGTGIPVVYTPNGVATNKAIVLVERALAPLTDRFVAVSESEGSRALHLGLASNDRLLVIRNGIDVTPVEDPYFDLRALLELPSDVRIVGTVARLVEQKSPQDFVRICAKVHAAEPDVHFVLVGSGELQDEVDAEVEAAGIRPWFHQIRYLERASLAIAHFGVFVLPSLFEGAPYTPLEAMRACVPVVLTEVTGSADTVQHELSGLLYTFGDTTGMADGVLRLLSDPSYRDSVVAAATQRFHDQFDRNLMGARLEDLYEELAVRSE